VELVIEADEAVLLQPVCRQTVVPLVDTAQQSLSETDQYTSTASEYLQNHNKREA